MRMFHVKHPERDDMPPAHRWRANYQHVRTYPAVCDVSRETLRTFPTAPLVSGSTESIGMFQGVLAAALASWASVKSTGSANEPCIRKLINLWFSPAQGDVSRETSPTGCYQKGLHRCLASICPSYARIAGVRDVSRET